MKKSILATLMILALISAVSAANGNNTAPVVGNETPEDNSVIERDYTELTGDGGVTLGIDAYDPAGGDVNVTFYNASNDQAIGTNITGEGNFTYFWDIDDFNEHNWYVEAQDNTTNVTTSDVFTFDVSNTDTTAPSITFESTPADNIFEREITVEGSTDEEARIEYKLDDGEYKSLTGEGDGNYVNNFQFSIDNLDNGDHTVTVRAEDRAGNSRTNSFSFSVADGSEITFQVNVDQSYPQSGIPIDPDSDTYPRDTEVDFNFTLEGNGNTYDISNGYQDGVCDFRGDDGWHLGSNYFCGTEVPSNIELGTYDLVAEWELRDETHRRVLDSSFPIEDTARWYSSQMSHGGRVEGSVNLNTEFTDNYETYNGQKVTCTGNTYRVKNIQQVTARCSNGVTSTSTPPVVSFVNREGQKVSTSNNDMFNDGDCQIGSGVTRQQLFGNANLDTDDQGYLPENCNLRWQLGGDSSFNAHTFTQPGNYNVYVDYPNAISNSPDYICPARTDNNNLCDVGSISQDASGWNNVEQESVKVVNTEGTIVNTKFSPNVVKHSTNSKTYIRRKDYTGEIQGTIKFENTGSGLIEVNNLDFSCPSNVECEAVTDLSGGLEVSSGETVTIIWTATPETRTTGSIDVELQYDDVYGLDCSPQKTRGWEYTLDEANPDTSEEVN